ncbi:MFS transporter [Nocardioides albus]|uniref:Multidrug efflux pump Tap n=1 Tax=Nocardioides albus TaxID=1841 RepID=A0A7W5A9R1_9ACTN|nr:MFS transporter [Nocardioides albus]MBB3092211.1 MFS family permease [Nocardioides albus]GGU46573.1 MFS transporter [Nocardioides albus]
MKLPLYGWLAAQTISLVGTRISMLALPWFVLETTGSPTKAGLIALFEMTPLVLSKIFGGPVIDRLGPRRVAISCDLGSAAVVGLIPLLYAADLLHFPILLLLVALAGTLRGPGDSAKSSMIPQLVEAAGVPTERATGLHSFVERTASMLGAVAAGLLIGLVGATNAIVIDAASFAVGALVLAATTAGLTRVRTEQTAERPEPIEGPGSYRAQLAEGWHFLRRDRVLMGIAFMVALTNLIDFAWASVLMPVWGQQHTGPETIGLLFATFAGFSALGSAVAAAIGNRMRRYPTYLVCFLVAGIPRFLVIAFGAPLWVVFVVFAIGGTSSGFINPILGALQFERIPAHVLGRVTSLISAFAWGLMPLGGLLGGGLVSAFGLTTALVACGIAYFVVTMFPAIDPTWKQIEKRPSKPLVAAES